MVLPSGVVMEAMACTSRSVGESTSDFTEPCTSDRAGPPQAPPFDSSSKYTMPFTPRFSDAEPSGRWMFIGKKAPSAWRRRSSHGSKIRPTFGEPSSSSPSATTYRFTGSVPVVLIIASSALRNARCGPF